MLERTNYDLRFYLAPLAIKKIREVIHESCLTAIGGDQDVEIEFKVSTDLFNALSEQFVDDALRSRVLKAGTFYYEVGAERWSFRVKFLAEYAKQQEESTVSKARKATR